MSSEGLTPEVVAQGVLYHANTLYRTPVLIGTKYPLKPTLQHGLGHVLHRLPDTQVTQDLFGTALGKRNAR